MTKYIAVLDVGTTSVRCFVYDEKFTILSTSAKEIENLVPQHGYHEIDPEVLVNTCIDVIKSAVTSAKVSYSDIVLGISTLRASFTTWNTNTGKTYHNIITWKDIRADDIVKKWNNSYSFSGIHLGSNFLYCFTRSQKFLAGSVIKLTNPQVVPKLLWCLQNNKQLQDSLRKNEASFGTVDAFLLYRLRRGTSSDKVETVMDVTNAIATGLYDPFTMSWAGWAINLFKIERKLLPKVVDNSHDFGFTHPSVFGAPVKISTIIADQSASMFGHCCFNKGDAKITLGTGTFFCINTAYKIHASIHGLYPQISYSIRDLGTVFDVEGSSNNTANVILWGMQIGLYNDPQETSGMAESVTDTDGVYFVPAFGGLSAPINDPYAGSGFIGIKSSTTKNHMTRAILESIVFRVVQLINASFKETNYKVENLRADGGVSKNDFVLQTLADVCQVTVERSDPETTSLGVAHLCAYNMNKVTIEELQNQYTALKVFKPKIENREKILDAFDQWEKAVDRFKVWYQN
ncbi:glycerol kinase 5-like [Chironomus tepperi]|uniref:glycerol kinase 5-like n=1 Tax=Chironomus tepperi TaxID=113505 RepID=UPI00391F7319